MRPGPHAVVVLFVGIVTSAACKDGSGDGRASARATEPRASRATEPREADVSAAAVMPEGGDAVGAAETAGSDDAATSPIDDTIVIADADAPDVVTAAMCRTACQNALRLTLAELPLEAAPTMRKEVTEALETACPTQCVKRGSLASVRCVEEAKTALELAACPR